jgi:hypothetical protein
MQGFFRWFGLLASGIAVSTVSLYVVSRLMPIPAEDAQALALVEAPRPPAGTNGFAALWSLPFDVPVADAERLLAEDAARFQALPIWSSEGGMPAHTSALARYPRLDAADQDRTLCAARQANCLAQVQARLQALAPVMASRAAITARIAALDDYGHFRSPFAARPDAPIPDYQPLLQGLAAHAHAFARGEHEQGLGGVCRMGSIARKLVASGDNLIGGVVGVALMEASAALFVDMLAELPDGHPLPDGCADVFEPDGVMVAGICTSMAGEGRYIATGFRAMNPAEMEPSWHGKIVAGIFLDQGKTIARGARRHAWFCGPQAAALVRADTPLGKHAPVSGGWTFSCIANATGCMLDNIAAPSLAGYAERFQDAEARLRVVAAWRWLRTHGDDARPLQERLAAWRKDHPAGREIRLNAAGDGLEIDLFRDGQAPVFALSLPRGSAGG